MINNIDIQKFYQIFKGKTNSYVKNELPKTKDSDNKKIKTRITTIAGNVDKDIIEKHLTGEFAVGICPITQEGKCYFGVIDIDNYTDKINKVLYFIREYQLPLIPFRSKSGGLHIYLLLQKSITGKAMRDILSKVVYLLALDNIFGKEKVEIFPKQDKADGFGSSITLPYFNCENTYTPMLNVDGSEVDFQDFLNTILKKLTTVEMLEASLSKLPYQDAPPCIQRILLSGIVGSEDSGRNNFLFSFSVYAKKKYGNGFANYVREINEQFECPLEDSVVAQICNSVKNNEYIYKCKDIPCNAYCNKVDCRDREYGLGRNKSHFMDIDFGQLYRYKTAEPYYVWKLRLVGEEEWKDVIFKDEGFLLDQKNFAKMCIRYLNQAPMQVSNNDWHATLNSILPNIQDVEVAQESDTSGLSILRNAFISFLANKQARRDCPFQIRVGLCVYQNDKYYFTHQGFYEYLKNQKISFDASLMRETLKSFGAKEDKLVYVNTVGVTVTVNCWSKDNDDAIEEEYSGVMEVAMGDKESINEITNNLTQETETKMYSEKDYKDAEDIF